MEGVWLQVGRCGLARRSGGRREHKFLPRIFAAPMHERGGIVNCLVVGPRLEQLIEYRICLNVPHPASAGLTTSARVPPLHHIGPRSLMHRLNHSERPTRPTCGLLRLNPGRGDPSIGGRFGRAEVGWAGGGEWWSLSPSLPELPPMKKPATTHVPLCH